MSEPYRSQRLDPIRHDTRSFTCGVVALDAWLREHAATEDVRGHSRTWVWVNAVGTVVGYYTLSAHKVTRDQVPGKMGRGGPREIPATLIGKLALHRDLRGAGLGALLLADALDRLVDASRIVGARLVVVDALTERVAVWYESLGFRRMPASLLLVQKVDDVAAARDSEPT